MSEFTKADVRRVIKDLAKVDQDGVVLMYAVQRKFGGHKRKNADQVSEYVAQLVADGSIMITGSIITEIAS